MTVRQWELPKSGFLEIGGKRLEFAAFGPPPRDAPSFVLLHEGLGSVAHWKDFPAKLSDATGCGVFAFSRGGYGRSSAVSLPRPLNYMTKEAAETLPRVLDASGIRKGILLGHSDGATIAAVYAGLVSDRRVAGLILIAPHFFAERTGIDSIRRTGNHYESGGLKQKLQRYHANVDNAFHGWCEAWLNPRFKEWNVADVIDGIEVPVFAIQGEQDPYGSLAQIEELKARLAQPPEVLIMKDCGHSPHRQKQQNLLNAVSEFANRVGT